MDDVHCLFDCVVTDDQLDMLARVFVSECDPYFFSDESLVDPLLNQGMIVYTVEEFAATFQTFGLMYGSLYNYWRLPNEAYVIFVEHHQITELDEHVRRRLYAEQVGLGRGHVYGSEWMEQFAPLVPLTIEIDGKGYFLLSSMEWRALPSSTRRRWLLAWLHERRHDEPQGVAMAQLDEALAARNFLHEYVGKFPSRSGPNCFAAAIAMAVSNEELGDASGRMLIHYWLHQGPFFRLLSAHGYEMKGVCQSISDMQLAQSGDVVVWEDRAESATHAAFVVKFGYVFNKMGQSWDQPWQVLRIENVYYNSILERGGRILIYRR